MYRKRVAEDKNLKRIPGLGRYCATRCGLIRLPNGKFTRGSLNFKKDYYRIAVNGRKFLVHRLIARTFVKNPRPDIFDVVDHISRDSHDNHADNLRYVNHQLNSLNKTARNACWDKKAKQWRAYFTKNRKHTIIGYFKTFCEAHIAGKTARQKHFDDLYKRLCDGEGKLTFI